MNPQNPWPSGYGFNTGVNVSQNPLYGGLPEIDITGFTGYLGAGKRTGVRGPEGDTDFVDNVGSCAENMPSSSASSSWTASTTTINYNQANGEIKFEACKRF